MHQSIHVNAFTCRRARARAHTHTHSKYALKICNVSCLSNLPLSLLSVPIVLPCTAYTKAAIEASDKNAVALVSKHGKILAILRNPEIYANRKEEIVSRIFGVIDKGHPYISHIYNGGDWLIGGEVELLGRIRYNDGLDKWRLTAPEVMREFEAKDADAVFAFQTRFVLARCLTCCLRRAGLPLQEFPLTHCVLDCLYSHSLTAY